MQKDPVEELEPKRVSRLLAMALEKDRAPEDSSDAGLAEALQTSLTATWFSLEREGNVWWRVIRQLLGSDGRAGKWKLTLGELLLDKRVELETIRRIRKRGKARATQGTGNAERMVGTTVYFAAIANALAFHEVKITTYSYEALRSSFEKLRGQPWMAPELAGLFQKAERFCLEKAASDEQAPEALDKGTEA